MKEDNPKILAWIHILEKEKEREQKRFNKITFQAITASWIVLLLFFLIS